MKTLITTACLLFSVGLAQTTRDARTEYFTHVREVNINAPDRQNYFDVDEATWAQASADLSDLRLYREGKDVPYRLVEEDATISQSDSSAKILQLGKVGGNTSFVVEVPADTGYNRLELKLATKNFVATASVEGMDDIHATRATHLGRYTLYDFAREGLGSSSILKLPESRFRFLRITLGREVPPSEVKAASVSLREEKKADYTAISASPKVEQSGKETVISWSSSEKVPLDRIVFAVDQVNFLRSVRIHDADGRYVGSGEISRVKMRRSGRMAESSNLDVDLAGARSRSFRVTISNGDDPPLQLKTITPQYVTRRVYFDPRGENKLQLYYGDEKLPAPSYEYAKLSRVEPNATAAQLGSATQNAAYTGRPDERPWSERHPAVLWTAMIAVVAGLGAVALRGLRKPA
jgi:Protein of unknown function (DUF3999)